MGNVDASISAYLKCFSSASYTLLFSLSWSSSKDVTEPRRVLSICSDAKGFGSLSWMRLEMM